MNPEPTPATPELRALIGAIIEEIATCERGIAAFPLALQYALHIGLCIGMADPAWASDFLEKNRDPEADVERVSVEVYARRFIDAAERGATDLRRQGKAAMN